MKLSTPLTAVLALVLLAGLINVQADDKNNPKNPPAAKPQPAPTPPPRQAPPPRPAPVQPAERPAERQRPPANPPDVRNPSDGRNQTPNQPDGRNQTPNQPSGRNQTPNQPSGHNQTPSQPSGHNQTPSQPSGHNQTPSQPSGRNQTPSQPGGGNSNLPTFQTRTTSGGGSVKTDTSGRVWEKTQIKSGVQHTEHRLVTGRVQKEETLRQDGTQEIKDYGMTGRLQREETRKQDGTQEIKHYDPHGRVSQEVGVNHDGTKQTTNIRYDRSGKERANEIIKVDMGGRVVSKTVVVHQTVIIKNGNNQQFVKNYDRGRFGFVYRPAYVVVHAPLVLLSSPYWYTPAGVVIVHPFRFDWGWRAAPWYAHNQSYWAAYDVYPEPSYWVTDYVIAGYAADRYEASPSVQQAQQDLNIAHEDMNKATAVVEKDDAILMQMAGGRDSGAPNDEVLIQTRAEIAEARSTQVDAENRTKNAEAQLAWAKTAKGNANEPNPNATPIDPQTKDDLRNQIAAEIAAQKEIAGQTAVANSAIPDISKALADPKYIYPVASSLSVVLAADGRSAGTVTEGDLLKLEPGQENDLKDANENTFVKMRVMSSKGEPGEVTAGTVISVPLKSLQDFDSEFHAKLDQGLIAANENQDKFK